MSYVPYAKNDYSALKRMAGFSGAALDLHLALYEGYINNANAILNQLQKITGNNMTESIEYAELKRRLGWEFDGMRLHELYFGELGGNGAVNEGSRIYKAIIHNFDDFETWKKDFLSTAKIRGIGWAILYQDMTNGQLINFWVNEHDTGHPAGCRPILVLDIFEHAYMVDYGKDKGMYLEAFMRNLNWSEIEKRLHI